MVTSPQQLFFPMTDLYLCRHGETEENVAGVLQGRMPGHLTAEGRRQAALLGQRLAALGVCFSALIVSDIERTMLTAHIANESLRLPLMPCPLLRERDWGSLTGKAIVEVRGMDFPPDVETVEAMHDRAARFLQFVSTQYAGSQVVAIGHGLFNRAIRATLSATTIRLTPRMENAEICHLQVPAHWQPAILGRDDVAASAN